MTLDSKVVKRDSIVIILLWWPKSVTHFFHGLQFILQSKQNWKYVMFSPVQDEKGASKVEPDADETEFLNVVGQQIVDYFKSWK